MPEENNNDTVTTRSLNWWLKFIASGVILFALAIAAYSYLFIYGGWETISSIISPETEPETDVATDFPELRGEIFLSAIVNDKEAEVLGFLPLLVFPDSDQFAYAPVDQLKNGSVFSLQYTVSGDLEKLTFLGWPLEEEYSHQTPSIYRADTGREGAASFDDVIESVQTTATLALEPDSEDYFRQGPVVSSAGDILYSSLSEADFDPETSVYASIPAEGWTIYKLNTNDERVSLTNGLSPKWVDENRFVFLKNDGVYLYDTTTKEEMVLWGLNFVPTVLNAFDVSDDSRLMAISNPNAGIVTIIERTGAGEEDAQLALFSDVAVKATGLTFATDSSYLAMLALVPSNEAGNEGFARLSYYSLEKKEFHSKFTDLKDANLQGLYLTDWK